ncbi:MAG: flagellar biosynthesis anti-sigma factor FlgM [Clostridiaceae bacterium]|nr:flagellar biosynthesis anti-sigma factor FlgM [Clostridiaceae bacterium]
MRVDALNHVSQVYQPSSAKKVGKADDVKKQDAYEISQSARDYQVAKKAVSEAADVREDKVAYYKEALASGTYNVSSQEIAEKIVSRCFDIQL